QLPNDHNPISPCKYFIVSPAFRQQFGAVTESELFQVLLGYCSNAGGGPLGVDESILHDDNGDSHVFHFETFFNRHEALTLAYHVRQHSTIVSVAASAHFPAAIRSR